MDDEFQMGFRWSDPFSYRAKATLPTQPATVPKAVVLLGHIDDLPRGHRLLDDSKVDG